MAVLQRQGMAAWIQAWDDLGPATRQAPPPRPGPIRSEQVVAVLAAMTLACIHKEATP